MTSPPAVRPPLAARSHQPVSWAQRVWQVVQHELRRQRVLVGLMWTLVVAAAVAQAFGAVVHTIVYHVVSPLSMVLAVVMPCRCVWASSASRPEVQVHTLPVGRGALLLGQVDFLVVSVVLPWVLLDVCTVWGFGYTPRQWLLLVLGSVLMVCIPIGLAAAWMSAARTYRQQGVIFIIAAIVWLLWSSLIGHIPDTWLAWLLPPAEERMRDTYGVVVILVQLIGAGLLGMGLWVFQTIFHRRKVMFYAALAGAGVLTLVVLGWRWDWKRPVAKPWEGAPLRIVLDGTEKQNPSGTTRLWQGLAVEGLKPGEVAAVSRLHPQKLLRWDSLWTGFSDASDRDRTERQRGPNRMGLRVDTARAIANHLPEGWLSVDEGNLHPRASLKEARTVISQQPAMHWLSSQNANSPPWSLHLAVFEPRLMAEFPLRDITKGKRPKELLLEPGLKAVICEVKAPYSFMELSLTLVSRRPVLERRPTGTSQGEPWGNISRCVYVVLLQDEQRLARVHVGGAFPSDQRMQTGAFCVVSELLGDSLRIDAPSARMQLTGLTREEWIAKTRVQIWWPELKGFVPLEIPAADVNRLAEKERYE